MGREQRREEGQRQGRTPLISQLTTEPRELVGRFQTHSGSHQHVASPKRAWKKKFFKGDCCLSPVGEKKKHIFTMVKSLPAT